MPAARAVLIDRHPLLRRGLAHVLRARLDVDVVLEAERAESVLGKLSSLGPDLVVTGVSLPGMSGLEFLKGALTLCPELRVLFLSHHDGDLYAERVVRAGARGYVGKRAGTAQVVQAVRTVLSGRVFLSEGVKDRILFGASGARRAAESPLAVLSDRELEVFEMTGRGVTTREAAGHLHLSVKTVESYRARIKAKLGFENGTTLMRHAVMWVEGEDEGTWPRGEAAPEQRRVSEERARCGAGLLPPPATRDRRGPARPRPLVAA